jgi:hypothetical protein
MGKTLAVLLLCLSRAPQRTSSRDRSLMLHLQQAMVAQPLQHLQRLLWFQRLQALLVGPLQRLQPLEPLQPVLATH